MREPHLTKVRWMRRALGVMLGTIAAMLVIWAIELVAQWLYPFPDTIETANRADLSAAMDSISTTAKAIVVSAWFAGAFCGAWLALRVCDWPWSGWIVVLFLIAGGIANLIAIPHPLWMQAATVVAPLAGGWIARRVHHKPYRGEPLLG
ncbi:hypothetical protein H5J25_18105 [Sphingomonas aliaeris]|uniref:Uncharacterized protein n=1 Tax=Sphingomonas aliaeris TaxID=2759526 RepID=A0A974NUH4_9SPHN|nr:hypothetical protein [Sphingomonas aliaeris]QQV77206.1 hypothetical protein H5J25_18105 [Sphingomonas aliaeris]